MKKTNKKSGTKPQLKNISQKKRAGTRKAGISLNKLDYPPTSIAHSVCVYMRLKEAETAESTFIGMKTHARHVIKHLGTLDITKLRKSDIDEFKLELIEKGVKGKVINSTYTVLRAVCNAAIDNKLRTDSPMEKICNVKTVLSPPNPLLEEEVKRLIAADSKWLMSKYMTIFGALSALRISELITISWENISFNTDENGEKRATIYVDLAKPLNQYKVTKTEASQRTLELSVESTHILIEMLKLTGHLEPVTIEVVQRDNFTFKTEQRRFVFYNDQTGMPWLNPKQFAKQFFTPFLASTGVEHRGPGQLRHTCASMHYNNGVSVAWIANLLGHTNVSIVEKHYAKFNNVRLAKEQVKADNNIRQLFTSVDEHSIVVPKTVRKPSADKPNKVDIPTLINLMRKAKTEAERDAIQTVISIALEQGGDK